ncbi:hypothetical protein [Lysobacter gummosus]|uniref:hypothetical protein n=1 Tax=Lysobacter gummosus TaxID=262324 RepID=UPI003644CDFB
MPLGQARYRIGARQARSAAPALKRGPCRISLMAPTGADRCPSRQCFRPCAIPCPRHARLRCFSWPHRRRPPIPATRPRPMKLRPPRNACCRL